MKIYKDTRRKLAVVLLILAVVATVGFYFTINYPSDVQYNRKFGTYVVIALQSASLERTYTSVMKIWENMNATFDTNNFDNIYNNVAIGPFNAGIIWENTLAAQNDYFIGLNQTIADRYEQLRAGNTIGITEQTMLYEIRNEMNSYGGLDWAIRGAWYIQYAPLAYWSGWIYGIGWTVAISIVVVLVLSGEERPYNSRYR